MKLTSFKIQNYRSIINTGWIKLAPDNISALIGQNESGKTSILEALNSFSNGIITEDILRSDLSLPVVSCEFYLTKKEKQDFSSYENLPVQVSSLIRTHSIITLNRRWINKTDSIVYFGNDEILEEYREQEENEKILISELIEKADRIMNDTSLLVENAGLEEDKRQETQRDLTLVQAKIDKLEKIVQRTRNERKKGTAQEELRVLQKEEGNLKLTFEKLDASFNKVNEKLGTLIRKSEYAEKFLNAREEITRNKEEEERLRNEVTELQEKLEFNEEEKSEAQLKEQLKQMKDDFVKIVKKKDELESNYMFARECFVLAVSGSGNNIESRAWERVEKQMAEMTLEDIGSLFFPLLPEFHLFEDFSSLLPNRIDLEDIMDMHKRVEGYNAAKNFLIVSGLDARFFRESSNRILKQKIENLNGEITLQFQGYWRQHLGKKNKISLNFELEHYDFSNPDKKGKPYLEFWIKDEFERLYPKQRSRGVRWFLSFYLELKATAMDKDKKEKILLIDEPGLSLHARAQEDVLKVFEDLKENIQIIYSTHSPHLVNTDKIYRLLAVQRADEDDDRSETRVFDAQSFTSVSGDTLSPIYTLLGSQISESNFIQERNNIIVEDTASFYYLRTLYEIFNPGEKVYFLPATGISSVPMLVNLMTGWKLKFGVMLSDCEGSREVVKEVTDTLYHSENHTAENRIIIFEPFRGFENLFSTIDFKKFVLKRRVGITEENLEYVVSTKINRTQLATSFALHCQNNPVKPSDFDDESRENIQKMVEVVKKLIG